MRSVPFRGAGALSLAAVFALLAGGCGQGGEKGGQAKDAGGKEKPAQVAQGKGKEGSRHEGWWCDEHGVPEAECSMCSAKAAAEFKKKGDWCNEHDRARSQCFACDPKAQEKYAAVYRAKEGKEPPEPADNRPATPEKQ
jgi:hypothetical protein